MLLPYGGTQRLAGCAPAPAFLHAGAAGLTALHCVQHADKLCLAAGQAAPQASLQGHVLPHRDDLPAAGYHVGVLRVLGPITGKISSSVDLQLCFLSSKLAVLGLTLQEPFGRFCFRLLYSSIFTYTFPHAIICLIFKPHFLFFQCVCHGTWTVLSTHWLPRDRNFGFKMRQKPGRFYYPWYVMEKRLTERSFLGLSFSVRLSLSFFHSSLLKLRSIRLWHQGSNSIAVLSALSSKLLKKNLQYVQNAGAEFHTVLQKYPLIRHTCPAPSPVPFIPLIASPRAHTG